MANFIYGKAKQALFNGQINFSANNYKLLFIKSSLYTPSQNSDEFVSNINASAIAYRTGNISNITNTLGTIDAADITIDSYSSGPFEAVVLYQVGSTDSSSRLVFYIDTGIGLPYTLTNDQVPITINWSNTLTKIMSL
jgi:hypothetical protein